MSRIVVCEGYGRDKDYFSFMYDGKSYNLEIDFNFTEGKVLIFNNGALISISNISLKTDNYISFELDNLECIIFIKSISLEVEYDIFINQVSITSGKKIETFKPEMNKRNRIQKYFKKAILVLGILSALLLLLALKYTFISDFSSESNDIESRLMIMSLIAILITFLSGMIMMFFNHPIHMESFYEAEDIKKLKTAWIITNSLNIIGFIMLFLPIFEFYPMKLLILLNAALPLIAVLIMWKYKGKVKLFDKSIYTPSVGFATLFTSIGLLSNIETYNMNHSIIFWIYFICSSGALMLYSYKIVVKNAMKRVMLLAICLNIMIYFYGAIIQVNCLLDYSVPRQVDVKVINTWQTGGRGPVYYIDISKLEQPDQETSLAVPLDFYLNVSTGQILKINIKKGLLGLKWAYPEKVDFNH